MNKLTAQITTTSINKETNTMNTIPVTITTIVDSTMLTRKMYQVRQDMDKRDAYSAQQRETMRHLVRSMEILRDIINNDMMGLYNPRPCSNNEEPFAWLATSTNTDVAPEAPTTTVDKDVDPYAAIKELRGWMAKTQAAGRSWAKLARDCGYTVLVDDGVIHVSIRFTPGDKDAYALHSDNIRGLLSAIPCTQTGSMWGNDGVGGMIAEERGCIDMAKSGVSKRFAQGAF